ncbi:ATP-binding protein [Allokutzneria sp. A3M-2-11 16]|uniref:sacsin N-terminal ATP-binding-like domain-containing protein n=1 Tax=Allokutzneria sp. A3M-2-11 16 TaxID=2962043 RepID=UPI0020B6D0AC|nr:ATP-binding protein [Allokutzneria sp. A3M-2-11 16]MCP3800117.1 ATP-binding protein [Allokutzneria sp. A3M-2-11 16]
MSTDPFGTAALRQAVLDAWRASPTRFREDANAEEDLRYGGYRDRLLVELAQNAADAAGGGGRLRLSIVDGELRAANTGEPLTAQGVAALASLRASPKRDVNRVGRFGVGFSAVLAVTDEPRVVSATGGIAFSADHTRSVSAELPTVAEALAERGGAVPVLRLVWPVEADEPGVPEGFTTEVRLPLRADIDADEVIKGFAAEAEDLLLALPGLAEVEVDGRRWRREDLPDGNLRVHGDTGTTTWHVHRRDGRLGEDDLHGLGAEARLRPEWTVCWAVQLDAAGVPKPLAQDVLHTPTPTDERMSLPARLLATLPVEPSRRRLMAGPAADRVLAAAAECYPELLLTLPVEHRTALVPLPGFPLSDVDGTLRDAVLAALRSVPWLTSVADEEVAPSRARVLDRPSAELAELLTDVLPNLLPAEFAQVSHAKALQALGVPRVLLAELVEAVTGLDRAPEWWKRLYEAVFALLEADPRASEELAALPVPLTDGRTAIGPRGTLVLDTDLSTVDALGLRLVHPEAVHPLLERLGAGRAGVDELLDAPELRASVERSVADAEAGLDLDVDALADAVLRLVERAGSRDWLGALALRDGDGEIHRADELLLPSSPLLDIFEEDAPLGVLAADLAGKWPAETLRAVGVLDGFTVLVDPAPTGPDHRLADEAAWWEEIDGDANPPAELRAVRDLDLVADDAWPAALRLLAEDPDTWRALTQPNGYTGWWLTRYALLDGLPPTHWRLPEADDLAGLYEVVPAEELSEELLVLLGVRSGLSVDDAFDAEDLLARLGDSERLVRDGTMLRAHSVLAAAVADGMVEPSDVDVPEFVRALTGEVVSTEYAVVLDGPWLLPVLDADTLVGGGTPEVLADLLDLPLASDYAQASVVSTGVEQPWADLDGVVEACDLIGVPFPDGSVVLHDRLVVRVRDEEHEAQWWRDDSGLLHTTDSPTGLGRALAHVLARWPQRHQLTALLASPTATTHLA